MKNEIAKKWGVNAMIITLIVFLGVLISMYIYLAMVSPGNPDAFKDENGELLGGSISEKIFVPIGGVQQGISPSAQCAFLSELA